MPPLPILYLIFVLGALAELGQATGTAHQVCNNMHIEMFNVLASDGKPIAVITDDIKDKIRKIVYSALEKPYADALAEIGSKSKSLIESIPDFEFFRRKLIRTTKESAYDKFPDIHEDQSNEYVPLFVEHITIKDLSLEILQEKMNPFCVTIIKVLELLKQKIIADMTNMNEIKSKEALPDVSCGPTVFQILQSLQSSGYNENVIRGIYLSHTQKVRSFFRAQILKAVEESSRNDTNSQHKIIYQNVLYGTNSLVRASQKLNMAALMQRYGSPMEVFTETYKETEIAEFLAEHMTNFCRKHHSAMAKLVTDILNKMISTNVFSEE